MKKPQKIYLVTFLIGSMLTTTLFVQAQNSKVLSSSQTSALINVFSAGADGTICSNDDFHTNGVTNTAGTTFWFTSGDGVFSNPFNLKATYMPGPHDIASGMVTLTLNILPMAASFGQLQDEVVVYIENCLTKQTLEH